MFFYINNLIRNINKAKKRYQVLDCALNKLDSIIELNYWYMLPDEVRYKVLHS
nr:CPPV233 ankyrin repeat protein [Cooks petrelpox virus]